MKRLISWHVDPERGKVIGIEDTGVGWGIVNSKGERVLAIEGYSRENREEIEKYQEEYLCRTRSTGEE